MVKGASGPVGAYLSGLGRFGWHLGLERIQGLLAGLSHPESAYPAVQVAGTNGKGSTAVTLAYLLAAAGYRTGLYTSPHLEHYRERFAIVEPTSRRGGWRGIRRRFIGEHQLAQVLLGQVAPVAGQVGCGTAGSPTEFEVLTAAAVQWFAAEKVDLAVLETGLGGRLDATTAIPAVLSVLTHIALDHTDRLGSTVADIAAEKAAIIRQGQPVIVAPQEIPAWAVIARRAEEQSAPLLAVGGGAPAGVRQAGLVVAGVSWKGTTFSYLPDSGEPLQGLRTALLGRHQAVNGAAAVAAALTLRERGFAVGEEDLRRGLAAVRWPGRFEVLRRRSLVVLDGAHNPDGLARLGETWRELAGDRRPIVVCGFLADKAVGEMVTLLAELAAEVIVARPENSRAADPGEVAAAFGSLGVAASCEPAPEVALSSALARAAEQGGAPILSCGSLYLVGALRRAWRRTVIRRD